MQSEFFESEENTFQGRMTAVEKQINEWLSKPEQKSVVVIVREKVFLGSKFIVKVWYKKYYGGN